MSSMSLGGGLQPYPQKKVSGTYLGPKIVTHQPRDTQYSATNVSKVNRDKFLRQNQLLHPELHSSRSYGTLFGTMSEKRFK